MQTWWEEETGLTNKAINQHQSINQQQSTYQPQTFECLCILICEVEMLHPYTTIGYYGANGPGVKGAFDIVSF